MIVGMMYCRNEADVLPLTIEDALKKVDSLFISDDGSSDKSWDIIKYYKANYPKIEHIQQKPNPKDQGQRQALLDEIRRRYKPEDTWVQLIDADMVLHTDNLAETIRANASENILVRWDIMNAVRLNWDGVYQFYPNWPDTLPHIMPMFCFLESVPYSFRPFPDLFYTEDWKPWPKGFQKHFKEVPVKPDFLNPPIILHYGYRGPAHVFAKMGGRPVDKYGQCYDSVETIKATFRCFSGKTNNSTNCFTDVRQAWVEQRWNARWEPAKK